MVVRVHLPVPNNMGVGVIGSAAPLEGGCCRFEPCLPYQFKDINEQSSCRVKQVTKTIHIQT